MSSERCLAVRSVMDVWRPHTVRHSIAAFASTDNTDFLLGRKLVDVGDSACQVTAFTGVT